jgi:subtilase family serine protease
MRTPKHFAPGFGMLASISRLVLGVMVGLVPSCALDDASMSEGPAASDDVAAPEDEDASSSSVCTSGTYRCHARVRTGKAGLRISSHAAPMGFGPEELQSAYNINPASTVTSKPTVAIVDAYGYAALESDLAMYRTQYGLPPCTKANGCLRVVNQLGQATPLPANPPANDDWTVETALDVDMVSAACPLCNILVVQATDNAGDGLFIAQNTATALGATVISDSWGGPEQAPTAANRAPQALEEPYFNHPGVAIFVAAGDDGYNDAGLGPDYPATSAHVIAVGGTRLVRDPSPRGWSETAWTKGGSACSLSIAKPTYQATSPCTFKATADIAAVGDPATGMAVYNTANGGWIVLGGTSASAPFVAAIFAATGNGAQSSGAFISSKANRLYDVTRGNNGACPAGSRLCNAGAGWDGPTGYGTPNAALLIPGSSVGTVGRTDGTGDSQDIIGGCSAGGGMGGGALLGLALLGLRRRR